MILELADLLIHSGQNEAFEEALARGIREVIALAPGFCQFQVERGIENPQRYLLQIHWQTLEDHTVGFRGSEAFTRWRAIVGPFFARPPVVEHFERFLPAA